MTVSLGVHEHETLLFIIDVDADDLCGIRSRRNALVLVEHPCFVFLMDHEINLTNAHIVTIMMNKHGQIVCEAHIEVVAFMRNFDQFYVNQISMPVSNYVEQTEVLVHVHLLDQCVVLRY